MNFDLQLNLTQKLVLSQALQQSLTFLQLPLWELSAHIRELSLSNPLIELEEEPLGDVSLEHMSGMEETNALIKEYASVNDNDSEQSAITSTIEYQGESAISADTADGSEAQDYTAYLSKPQTLSEYLHEQLGLRSNIEEPYLSLVSYLIDCLSSTGYLDIPIEELAAELSVPVSDMEEALFTLQSLDPAGVGARTLSECLLIQLSQLDAAAENVSIDSLVTIIMKGLPQLAAHDYKALSKLTGLSDEALMIAVNIIKSLNPIPSRGFFSDSPNAVIIPDAYVNVDNGSINISINRRALPNISINSYYSSLISGSEKDYKTAAYLKDKIKEANEAISGLRQRACTLEKVLNLVVSRQIDFFLTGGSLKPLTRNELAEKLGLSSSTISRAVKDKYLQFDGHILPLDTFFSNAVSPQSGQNISSRAIQDQLRRIIADEDKTKPLSDQAIEEHFAEMGINVSRRTIAKYRSQMDIPSASGRKHR
ncbi:MAG: RNA polymerase factor sigma-54 [Lachnospiraceae bacterium]|nr:RNA polymerase factor sigma-54 [Lachnospiraceae bacterium]